jgi:hypothetical protein
MGAWVFFDVCLLACGAIAIGLSVALRAPNVLMNMVFSNADLTAGTVLGVALLLTFAISIGAIVQRNHVTIGLVILNWALIVDATGILIIGTSVWFYTLRERAEFHGLWAGLTSSDRITLQDQFQCCGYFSSSDFAEVGGKFCANSTFVQNVTSFCVGPVTSFADTSLNDVFTTVYGFMAVIIGFFLVSICVINKRLEDERFKKIDARRGKSFV